MNIKHWNTSFMKPSILILTTLLLVSLAPLRAAEPALVAHWNFDEGRGDVAKDSRPRGRRRPRRIA